MPQYHTIEAQQNFLCMFAGPFASLQQGRYSLSCSRGGVAQRFALSLNEIKFDHRVFELSAPLCVELFKENELWYCKDEGENFLARGDSMDSAVHSLSEDFAVYWRVIAQLQDGELDERAQVVKRFMHSIVKSVITE